MSHHAKLDCLIQTDILWAICYSRGPSYKFHCAKTLTRAIAGEMGCHMANRRHNMPKLIALDSLGFCGRKKAKSNLKQLNKVEF